MIQIKDGGKTNNLQEPIAHIGVCSPTDAIELWIIDKNGNESLSYLTMEEACALTQELKTALKRKINRI